VRNKLNGAVYIANEYLARLPYIEPYVGAIPAAPQPITMKINSLQTIAAQSQEAAAQQESPDRFAPQPYDAGDHRPAMEGPVPQEVQPYEVPGYWDTPQGQAMLDAAAQRLVNTHPAEPIYADPGPALPLPNVQESVQAVNNAPVVRRRPPPPRG
jgi:hypothetical protein